MKMNAKKWTISLIALTMAAVLLFGAVEFCLDPLLCYRSEDNGGFLTYRHYSEIYANPGIARNYKYSAVLLGSSMVENTDVSEIDRLFSCVTIKVPYSGGSSYNHRVILDLCYGSENKIEKVFWALDEYALTTDVNTPRYPLPEYLYDDNTINDISYLLNLDIFYFYTIKDIIGTLRHQRQPLMRDGTWIKNENIYCRKNALASVSYPMEQANNRGSLYYQKKTEDNLRENILPFLAAHPETEFHFYMVPYSILYWYRLRQNGTLEAEIHAAKMAVSEILQYSNAKVHFFQDDEQVITDLDLYKDYSHFKPAINSYMSQEMANGNHLLTKETCDQRFDALLSFVETFDYEALVNGDAALTN